MARLGMPAMGGGMIIPKATPETHRALPLDLPSPESQNTPLLPIPSPSAPRVPRVIPNMATPPQVEMSELQRAMARRRAAAE